jgi:hypothetical protein
MNYNFIITLNVLNFNLKYIPIESLIIYIFKEREKKMIYFKIIF